MPPPLPRRSGWTYSSLVSSCRISLPRKGCRVGLRIVLFEACSALTRVAACLLARSPYFRTRYPKASDISSSPCLLRLLPAGAVVGWGLHQLESAALSRHTPTAVIYPGSGNASAPEPEFGSRVTTNVTRAGIAPKCRTLALCAIDRTSGRCARTRVSPDHLRRLPQGAQEGAAQAGAIGEARLPSDDVDRMPALLHHQPGGLDAQVLDRLGRRLAGFGAECTAELARTEMRRCGDLSNGQRLSQGGVPKSQGGLDTVGFGLQLQQR